MLEFTCRFIEKLESHGDTTISAKQHSGAISHYPPSLQPTMLRNLLIKRSKAYMAKGLLVEALNDAKKVRCFVSCRLAFVNRSLPGVRAWFTVCMGLRECMPHYCNKRSMCTGCHDYPTPPIAQPCSKSHPLVHLDQFQLQRCICHHSFLSVCFVPFPTRPFCEAFTRHAENPLCAPYASHVQPFDQSSVNGQCMIS